MGKRFSLTPQDVLGPNGVIDGFKAMRDRGKVGFFGFSGLGESRRRCTSWSIAASFMAFSATTICSIPAPAKPVPATSAPWIMV